MDFRKILAATITFFVTCAAIPFSVWAAPLPTGSTSDRKAPSGVYFPQNDQKHEDLIDSKNNPPSAKISFRPLNSPSLSTGTVQHTTGSSISATPQPQRITKGSGVDAVDIFFSVLEINQSVQLDSQSADTVNLYGLAITNAGNSGILWRIIPKNPAAEIPGISFSPNTSDQGAVNTLTDINAEAKNRTGSWMAANIKVSVKKDTASGDYQGIYTFQVKSADGASWIDVTELSLKINVQGKNQIPATLTPLEAMTAETNAFLGSLPTKKDLEALSLDVLVAKQSDPQGWNYQFQMLKKNAIEKGLFEDFRTLAETTFNQFMNDLSQTVKDRQEVAGKTALWNKVNGDAGLYLNAPEQTVDGAWDVLSPRQVEDRIDAFNRRIEEFEADALKAGHTAKEFQDIFGAQIEGFRSAAATKLEARIAAEPLTTEQTALLSSAEQLVRGHEINWSPDRSQAFLDFKSVEEVTKMRDDFEKKASALWIDAAKQGPDFEKKFNDQAGDRLKDILEKYNAKIQQKIDIGNLSLETEKYLKGVTPKNLSGDSLELLGKGMLAFNGKMQEFRKRAFALSFSTGFEAKFKTAIDTAIDVYIEEIRKKTPVLAADPNKQAALTALSTGAQASIQQTFTRVDSEQSGESLNLNLKVTIEKPVVGISLRSEDLEYKTADGRSFASPFGLGSYVSNGSFAAGSTIDIPVSFQKNISVGRYSGNAKLFVRFADDDRWYEAATVPFEFNVENPPVAAPVS